MLGGYHPTALPIEAKKHADAVVIGEAETTWQQAIFHQQKEYPLTRSFQLCKQPEDVLIDVNFVS